MYLIILKVLVYYQLLRAAQADREAAQKALRDEQAAHGVFRPWYNNHKKPQVEQLEKTINDLKMTIQTLTVETGDLMMTNQSLTKEMDDLKVNHTPNNISDNNINNHINNISDNNINNHINRCNSNTHIITSGEG